MDKPVYLGRSILELSKILMYDFWNDMDTYISFIQFHCLHKNSDIYKDIGEDVETRFNTSNDEL